MTLRNGKFLSLLLSAISHIDVWRLLYNLMALLSLGPSVQAVLESKLSTKGFVRPKYPDRSIFASIDTAMWLLVLGAALSGSIAYLLWNELCGTGGSEGGCLGLSSVTMSMLSIYASAYPDRILQFRVGGIIPVRLPAHQILLLAFVGSIVGCLFPVIFKSKRNDGISHSGHLGGLIFGVVYYDIAIMNRRPFINSFFATLYSRFQRAVSKNSDAK
jgi:membrane associated rhomboid family serine protease